MGSPNGQSVAPEVTTHPAAEADQSVAYGRQFVDVYDRIFPSDEAAALTAGFLRELVQPADSGAVEFGVGTGRVAIPLARLGVPVTGIDTSTALLERARTAAALAGADLGLQAADIRSWRPDHESGLAYCICGTISMLACEKEQAATLANLAASVHPGGHVVIETHSPDRVLWLHRDSPDVTFNTEFPAIPGGLQTHSSLAADERRWSVEHSWHDGSGGRSAREFSRLTGPDVIDALAAAVGLLQVDLVSSWDGAPYDPMSPTYIATYQRTTDPRFRPAD